MGSHAPTFELCCRLKRARRLRSASGNHGPFNAYVVARLGSVHHRTHVVEDASEPEWQENLVFASDAIAHGGRVVTFEVWNQGFFSDELIAKAYLELDMLDPPEQPPAPAPPTPAATGDTTPAPAGPAAAAAGGAPPSPAARASEAGSGSTPSRRGSRTIPSPEQRQVLTLLPGSSKPLPPPPGGANAGKRRPTLTHSSLLAGKSDRSMRRSGRVLALGELDVSVYWVREAPVGSAGDAPRLLSFVPEPGQHHPVPCTTHVGPAALYEEPCIAFVKLSVNGINLGLSGAHASPRQIMHHLKRMLLGGQAATTLARRRMQEAAAEASEAAAEADDGASAATPLASLDSDLLATDPEANAAISKAPSLPPGLASMDPALRGSDGAGSWDWLKAAAAEEGGAGGGGGIGGGALDSSDPEDSDDFDEEGGAGEGAAAQQRHTPLYLTLRAKLGSEGEWRSCQPAEIHPDGDAPVHSGLLFATPRPLDDATLNLELTLHQGRDGMPRLVLTFAYSLLQLLLRSPAHPYTFEEWRVLRKDALPGLHVPLPGLPDAFLDLSAILADADCRAGMFRVPALSSSALQSIDDYRRARRAARNEAATEAAAFAAAEAELAAEAAAAAAEGEGGDGGDGGDGEASGSGQQPPQRAARRGVSWGGEEPEGKGEGPKQEGPAGGDGGDGGTSPHRHGGLRKRLAGKVRRALHGGAGAAGSDSDGSPGRRGRVGEMVRQLETRWDDRVHAVAGRLEGKLERAAQRAVDALPARMAKKVKSADVFRRFFPGVSKKVLSFGQLRVPTQKHILAPDFDFDDPMFDLDDAEDVTAAGAPSETSAADPLTAAADAAAGEGSRLVSARSGAGTSGGGAAASIGGGRVGSASVLARTLQRHPNLAVSGSPETTATVILELTVTSIQLDRHPGAAVGLVVRCGPHWVSVSESAVPVPRRDAAPPGYYPSDAGATGPTESGDWGPGPEGGVALDGDVSATASSAPSPRGTAQPLQMLFPVYATHAEFGLAVHRRGTISGRLTFRITGVLPLLAHKYAKTLTLYRDKRDDTGKRGIAGRVQLTLSARFPAGHEGPRGLARLAWSYVLSPLPLAMLTSSVAASFSADQRAGETRRIMEGWLDDVTPQIPPNIVRRMMASGRGRISRRRLRAQLQRIKDITQWLPRKWDPMSFYYWKRPWVNLLTLWVLSHVCLHPAEWLFSMTVVFGVWMARRAAIQFRSGVLGWEVACPVVADDEEDEEVADALTQLAKELLGKNPGESAAAYKGRYKMAASRLREQLGLGPAPPAPSSDRSSTGGATTTTATTTAAAAAKRGGADRRRAAAGGQGLSLEVLQRQLVDGDLDFGAIEGMLEQATTIPGMMRLLTAHGAHLRSYGLLAQNILDDAVAFAEGLFAMASAQDVLAGAWFYGALLASFAFCWAAGLGWGAFVLICYLLRPPFLRGVPGVFGFRAYFANLPARSVEDFV